MKQILSFQNPKFKSGVRLLTSRGRNQQDRFLIHGIRELTRALESAIEVFEIFICSALLTKTDQQFFVERAQEKQIQIFDLPPELFIKIAYGEREDGVVGVAARPSTKLENIQTGQNSFVMVVEGIEKPGNLGAIARSADGAGADALILTNSVTDFFHPNAIHSSLGTTLTLQTAEGSSEEVEAWLRKKDFEVFSAIVDAKQDYYEIEYPARTAIVLGSESKGLSEVWRKDSIRAIRIPMQGIADSLNVSVTAAILAFEVSRQRKKR